MKAAEEKEDKTHIRWTDSSESGLGVHKRWVDGPEDGSEDEWFNYSDVDSLSKYNRDPYASSKHSDLPGEYSPDDSFNTIERRIVEIEAIRALARVAPKDRTVPTSDVFAYWPDGSRSLPGNRATRQTESIHRHVIVPTTGQVKQHVAAFDGRSMAQRFASRGERDLYDEKLRYAYRFEPVAPGGCSVPMDSAFSRVLEAMQTAVDTMPLHPDSFPNDCAFWPDGSRGLPGECETTLSKTTGRLFIVPTLVQVQEHFAAGDGVSMADRFAPSDEWCFLSVPLSLSVSGGGVGSG